MDGRSKDDGISSLSKHLPSTVSMSIDYPRIPGIDSGETSFLVIYIQIQNGIIIAFLGVSINRKRNNQSFPLRFRSITTFARLFGPELVRVELLFPKRRIPNP